VAGSLICGPLAQARRLQDPRLVGRANIWSAWAWRVRIGTWPLGSGEDLELQLRGLAERGDIIKTLHATPTGQGPRPGRRRDPGRELGGAGFRQAGGSWPARRTHRPGLCRRRRRSMGGATISVQRPVVDRRHADRRPRGGPLARRWRTVAAGSKLLHRSDLSIFRPNQSRRRDLARSADGLPRASCARSAGFGATGAERAGSPAASSGAHGSGVASDKALDARRPQSDRDPARTRAGPGRRQPPKRRRARLTSRLATRATWSRGLQPPAGSGLGPVRDDRGRSWLPARAVDPRWTPSLARR
jgi:hypothetical protein